MNRKPCFCDRLHSKAREKMRKRKKKPRNEREKEHEDDSLKDVKKCHGGESLHTKSTVTAMQIAKQILHQKSSDRYKLGLRKRLKQLL